MGVICFPRFIREDVCTTVFTRNICMEIKMTTSREAKVSDVPETSLRLQKWTRTQALKWLTTGQYGHLRVLRCEIRGGVSEAVHHPRRSYKREREGGNSRRPPREPHEALARNDVPAREQHGRVLRRRLFLRDGARKDRVVPVRQRERDLDLCAFCRGACCVICG